MLDWLSGFWHIIQALFATLFAWLLTAVGRFAAMMALDVALG